MRDKRLILLPRRALIGLILVLGLGTLPERGDAQAPAGTEVSTPASRPDAASPPAPAPAPTYDPGAAFAPLTMPDAANRYRSASGAPGPNYWQNRADYVIAARLEPKTKTLSATVTITYTNNSPDALEVLGLHLEQNNYRRDSRASIGGSRARTQFTDGDVLDNVEIETGPDDKGDRFVAAPYVVSDTRLMLHLPSPLKPAGGRIRLRIAYHYTVPGSSFGGRTAWSATPQGEIYDIAQWYPRMAVYDDVRGWDPLPYLGAEFNLEYGNFDYAITVPADMIVAGSGTLTDPAAVLTPTERARLAAAAGSDKTVMIRTADDVADTLTIRPNQDLAFPHGPDARRGICRLARFPMGCRAWTNLSNGKTARPNRSTRSPGGRRRGLGPIDRTISNSRSRIFSRRWYPYLWPNAINVAGAVGGAWNIPRSCSQARGRQSARSCSGSDARDRVHTYFPMIVGSDERRYGWMDEALNTFIDVFVSDALLGGVYGPKHDQEFAPGSGPPADQIAALIADPKAPPIMTRADSIPVEHNTRSATSKRPSG